MAGQMYSRTVIQPKLVVLAAAVVLGPIGAVLPPDVRHHRVRIFFPLSFSSVGFAAVADAEDIDPVAVVVESDAPVADAQTELRRVNSVGVPLRCQRQ